MTGQKRISPNGGPHSPHARGRLIATWQPGQSPDDGLPATFRWSNGDQASPADYEKHLADTNFDLRQPDGSVERHYVVDVVADVFYDVAAGTWALKGPWWTTALQVPSPAAEDDAIRLMASTLPVRFRLRIHRECD